LETLKDRYSGCFPDILENLNQSLWRGPKLSVNLTKRFPEQVRQLLEDAIRERGQLTSLFRHGGSEDDRVLRTTLRTLGETGNENSIPVLTDLVEDPHFGKDAVQSIQALRRRL
jgi:hypothetical protein